MLDVHPPQHAAHSWRDFLIHIATIVVGLCIAIGLEQAVEYFHHRHIVREARENIREEIRQNQQRIAEDSKGLEQNFAKMNNNIDMLEAVSKNPAAAESVKFSYDWSGAADSAYMTARDTGALALMPYDEVQGYAGTYFQQGLVNEEALAYLRHGNAAATPLMRVKKVSDLSPEKMKALSDACEQSMGDIRLLQMLIRGLDANYQEVLAQK